MGKTVWRPAYIGLGSNLEQPLRQVEAAFKQLAELPETMLVARSQLYNSPPMGPQDQPDFVNAVAATLTTLDIKTLFQHLLAIEKRHGRERGETRWGPRTLDLDLLVYGDRQLTSESLVVPHPGIPARGFVLYPLAEISADLDIPGIGVVRDLLAAVRNQNTKVIATASEEEI